MIVKAAAILFLIALSGCAEKGNASDPPAVGIATDSGSKVPAEMPPKIGANNPPAAETPAKAENEPTMTSPVQFD